MINQTHRRLLSDPHLQALRDDTITFASVSGQSRYGLPQALAMVQAITDRTTNIKLRQMSLSELRSRDPGLVTSGVPQYYVLHGTQAVSVQPSAAAQIFAVSTAVGDTVPIVNLSAVRSTGDRVTLTATLTGTTAVSFSAVYTDIVEVVDVFISGTPTGTVSIRQTSGAGTVLASIPPGSLIARYQGVQLWPTPTSAITYYADYVRTLFTLTNTADEPLLPEDFHWMIVEGTLVTEYTKHDDSRRVDADRMFQQGYQSLVYRLNCPPDFLPSRARLGREYSRLGAQYPGGSGVW